MVIFIVIIIILTSYKRTIGIYQENEEYETIDLLKRKYHEITC